MGPTRQWIVLVFVLGLACAAGVPAAEFTLTPAENQRVSQRQVVLRANLDSNQRRGTVRAAMHIEAPPEVVFQMLTHCAEALEYVPHLRECRVRDRAADDSWLVVEQVIDFGWYAPRVSWVFRSEVVPNRRINFRQVSGDFKANEGFWEFEPTNNGTTTLLLYQATIDPPGFVPNWLARSTYRRELPAMLTGLRQRCEAEQSRLAKASAAPH
jgi:ribosome-associated toxin RatA of RatAB toxin-antitoxin module